MLAGERVGATHTGEPLLMAMISPNLGGSSNYQYTPASRPAVQRDANVSAGEIGLLLCLAALAAAAFVLAELAIGLGALLTTLWLGLCAGVLTAIVRLKGRKRIIEELITAVLSPETITALQVRWSATALFLAIGLGSGFLAASLGLTGDHGAVASSLSFVGPWVSGACVLKCPTGGGGGGLAAALLIGLCLFLLVLALSVGVSAVLAALGKGLVGGAAQGGAQALGVAIVLALTRLWTTRLADAASRAPPEPLSLPDAIGEYARSQGGDAWTAYALWQRKERVEATPEAFSAYKGEVVKEYLHWLAREGIEVTTASLAQGQDAYLAQSRRWREHLKVEREAQAWPVYARGTPEEIRQRPLRKTRWHAADDARFERRVLGDLATTLEQAAKDREPRNRIRASDDAPVFDGSQEALFHPRWFRSAIYTGMREGALVGVVSTILAILVFGLHN
jgi:hypothetical protein